jgi:eukaryotic-like serine/threonine-protein kinase
MTSGDELVPVGVGPVATVYGGLYVAMKVYPTAVDSQVLDAIEEEQTKLAPLRNNVPILPVDELVKLADGRPALQMELCTMSLATLVADEGELGVADVLTVGHAVAVALAAAHGAGVVHGGLTPHNVLFHPSGEPVVADFGVALRDAFPPDPPHEAEYAAPETLRDGTRDEWSDLYGLGGVLFLALAAHPPPSVSPAGPVPPRQRDDVPVELTKLVTRLLANHPADRPSTADAVVSQLAGMLATLHEPADTPDPRSTTLVEPTSTRRRPNLTFTIGIAAVMTVLIAAAVPGYFRDATSPSAAPAEPPVSAAPSTHTVPVTLANPTDQGTYVELSWQAPQDLTFAVAVAAENQKTQVLIVHQNRTTRVPVDPHLKYCFQIQATDGDRVLESPPQPIRGAICTN